MGFFSGMFGKNSPWDGSKYIARISGQNFWHIGFIDKDKAIDYGLEFARTVDPAGARRRSQDKHSLIGELICYFQMCEEFGDEKALRYIANAMKVYEKENPDQHALGYFISYTNYLNYQN